jgi:histone H3/H4
VRQRAVRTGERPRRTLRFIANLHCSRVSRQLICDFCGQVAISRKKNCTPRAKRTHGRTHGIHRGSMAHEIFSSTPFENIESQPSVDPNETSAPDTPLATRTPSTPSTSNSNANSNQPIQSASNANTTNPGSDTEEDEEGRSNNAEEDAGANAVQPVSTQPIANVAAVASMSSIHPSRTGGKQPIRTGGKQPARVGGKQPARANTVSGKRPYQMGGKHVNRPTARKQISTNNPRGRRMEQIENNRKKRKKETALMEIRKWQRSTENIINKAPFKRVVDEILKELEKTMNICLRMNQEARMALLEASEVFLVHSFEDANLCAPFMPSGSQS